MNYDPRKFNVFYASSIIIGLTIAYLALRNEPETIPTNQDSIFIRETVSNPATDTSAVIHVRNDAGSVPDKMAFKAEKSIIAKSLDITEEIKPPEVSIITPANKHDKAINLKDTSFTPASMPLAYFIASTREGCVPLTVEFKNLSQNDVFSSWAFGDGGTSTIENPVYIFDEPGTYFVNLSIVTRDKELSAYSDSIHVYPLPKPSFIIEKDEVGVNGPVYFYNHSQGGESYLWDFGDGNNSILREPVHYYSRPGNYNVKLVITSFSGCRDSVILVNALDSQKPELRFPNAFTPNLNGPGNGYYSQNSMDNDVFHPITDEEVSDYQLRIFTREGLLLFESNDFNIGWDGYYREKLMPQKVYIWKVRGKFRGGHEFVQAGNVTLIWKSER